MTENHYAFDARPGAVFRIGWHWLEVIKRLGPFSLQVFTSERRHHLLDVSVLVGLFPEIWVGLMTTTARQAIIFTVPKGVLVHAHMSEADLQ